MKRTSRDATALPSLRSILFGIVALGGAILLTAWILSGTLNRPAKTALATPAPVPPPLQPTAAWVKSAGVVNDARAVSALMLVSEGRWTEADQHVRAMYRGAARGDARDARESNEAGLAHFRRGDTASAIRAFEAASRADPGDVEIANNLGYAYLKSGRSGEAIAHFVRSLQLVPARSTAWGNLAEALAVLGYEEAAQAALLLMVRHAINREEIREYLVTVSKDAAAGPFQRQAARALSQLDRVPRG